MNKNKVTVLVCTIAVLAAGGYWLLAPYSSNDTKVSSSVNTEAKAPSLDTTALSGEGTRADDLKPKKTLKDPLASLSKAHVHGPNCNHGNDAGVATAVKPLNHEVLPWMFESVLSSDAETGEKYFLTNNAVFSSLRKATVGDEVAIDLAHNVVVNGTLKALKTYPQDAGLLKGIIELADEGGQLFFFQSSEKLNSNIVFNEKSVALVYKDGETGPAYVQTPISDLFCSSEGAVYPLDHPSNGKPFLQVSQ